MKSSGKKGKTIVDPSAFVDYGDNRELLSLVRLAAEKFDRSTLPSDFIQSSLSWRWPSPKETVVNLAACDRSLSKAMAEGCGDVEKTVATFNREFCDLLGRASARGLASIVMDATKGGKHEKRRKVIYQAIVEYMRNHLNATNNEVWDSFPESYDEAQTVGDDLCHTVFRDGAKLYQVESSGKKDKHLAIKRTVFDGYVTKARDALVINTRRKKRS